MLLKVTTVVLLVVFIHYVEGFKRVVVVNESDVDVYKVTKIPVSFCIYKNFH